MRKIISVVLVLAMLVSMFALTASAEETATVQVGKVEAGYTPEGTAIGTPEELAALEGQDGKYYLTADITATAMIREFKGTLDGNGHTITVSAPLFRILRNGTVKNLTVVGEVTTFEMFNKADIEGDPWGNDGASSPLACAALDATFENILNRANLTVTKPDENGVEDTEIAKAAGGGIFGQGKGDITVTNCRNEGNITCGHQVGGILGWGSTDTTDSKLIVQNCSNAGKVTSTASYVGGIAGRASDDLTYFLNCTNEITAEQNCYISQQGGILGYAAAADAVYFVSCVNYQDIYAGKDKEYTGTNENYFTDVDGKKYNGVVAGGIAGKTTGDLYILYCINYGNIYGNDTTGGLIGHHGSDGKPGLAYIFGSVNFGNLQSVWDGRAYRGQVDDDKNPGQKKDGSSTAVGIGGIIGYQYGNDTQYAIVMGCLSAGDVTGTVGRLDETSDPKKVYGIRACGILGYQNSDEATFTFNLITGAVSSPLDNLEYLIGWNNAVAFSNMFTNNNFAIKGETANGIVSYGVKILNDPASAQVRTPAEAVEDGFLTLIDGTNTTLEAAVAAVNAERTLWLVEGDTPATYLHTENLYEVKNGEVVLSAQYATMQQKMLTLIYDEATYIPPVTTEPEETDPAPTEPVVTEPETAPVTQPQGTQAPGTTAPAEEEGCGSAIAGVLAIVAVLGTAIVIKRK